MLPKTWELAFETLGNQVHNDGDLRFEELKGGNACDKSRAKNPEISPKSVPHLMAIKVS